MRELGKSFLKKTDKRIKIEENQCQNASYEKTTTGNKNLTQTKH